MISLQARVLLPIITGTVFEFQNVLGKLGKRVL